MKEIKGFEDYLIDEKGNVYSKHRNRFLNTCIRGDGYAMVGLYKDGMRKNFQIHRLVAEAFIPNPDGLPQVNHKDENKLNNNVDNLEWCTAQYNLTYGNRIFKACQKRKENDPEGKSYIRSMETRQKNNPHNECFKKTVATRTLNGCVNAEKSVSQYDINGNFIKSFRSLAEAAKETNSSAGCICNCLKGRSKTHKGFAWKYN